MVGGVGFFVWLWLGDVESRVVVRVGYWRVLGLVDADGDGEGEGVASGSESNSLFPSGSSAISTSSVGFFVRFFLDQDRG